MLDGGDAFLPDSRRGPIHLADEEADAFAEEFLAAATSAETVSEDARDEVTIEELGGPFLELEEESPEAVTPLLAEEEESEISQEAP